MSPRYSSASSISTVGDKSTVSSHYCSFSNVQPHRPQQTQEGGTEDILQQKQNQKSNNRNMEKKLKSVQFVEYCEVYLIPTLDELSVEEYDAIYYTKYDYRQIQLENIPILLLMNQGIFPETNRQYFRGLEFAMEDYRIESKYIRSIQLQTILLEQRKHAQQLKYHDEAHMFGVGNDALSSSSSSSSSSSTSSTSLSSSLSPSFTTRLQDPYWVEHVYGNLTATSKELAINGGSYDARMVVSLNSNKSPTKSSQITFQSSHGRFRNLNESSRKSSTKLSTNVPTSNHTATGAE